MFFKANDDEHDNIQKAVDTLRAGGVALYQTTSPWHWALSCDATNEVAVKKLISLKQGIVHHLDRLVVVQDERMQDDFIAPTPSFVRQFLYLQEKNVTVIFPSAARLARSACLSDGSVPVRILPSNDLPPIQMSRHVVRLLGKPIFASSCTIGDGPLPLTYEEISQSILSGVDIISPLLFGIDDTATLSMVMQYDTQGHVTVVRR